PELEVSEVPEGLVQGVTETTIKVGNTAAISGAYAEVGVPFNAGITAAFAAFNLAGGVNGRTIEFVTYDDAGSSETGKTLTTKLIEEDEVFALVGHFGTWTVGATLPDIIDAHIPMVYAATGINSLYFQETPGNPVMAIQPIYKTDGRISFARAINEMVYGEEADEALPENAKIGVLYTNDDAGKSIASGIFQEATTLGYAKRLVVQEFSDSTLATSAQKMVDEEVSAVLIAANQVPFKNMLVALDDVAFASPVFASYVNSNISAVTDMEYSFNLFGNAWIDISYPEVPDAPYYGFSPAYWAFATVMTTGGFPQYAADPYAMAGYIAAQIFIEGLVRVDEDELTWKTFITAMESEPIEIPMGGTVDFGGGKRWGVAAMSLLQYHPTTGETAPRWAKIRDIQTIDEINAN
ncbi:MAG: ABC transporter substrate-binding protein, partial [Acholeplasmataceae bacterium]|nr:ABC transporter substrate-binding protein [Acholeplasmataceae bacterium]